ncbi:hypothetical protein ACWDNT_32815, partial [Streptomyces sp. NPDC000963]
VCGRGVDGGGGAGGAVDADGRRFDSRRTAGAAAELGVRPPALTEEVLVRYLAYFRGTGFLPAPDAP